MTRETTVVGRTDQKPMVLYVEGPTRLVGRSYRHRAPVHPHEKEVKHPVDRAGHRGCPARATVRVRAIRPADRIAIEWSAPADGLKLPTTAPRHIADRPSRGRWGVALVDVCVAVEDDVDAMSPEHRLDFPVALKPRV